MTIADVEAIAWIPTVLAAAATGVVGAVGGLVVGRQKRKHEREASFHQGRVEAVKSVWAALGHAHRVLLLPADVQGWIAENQHLFDIVADEFRRKLIESRLYFPPDVETKLETYWQAMKDAGWATKSRSDKHQRGWYERYLEAREKMEHLKAEIDADGRRLLGDPEMK
jgi:hypothetical protein